MNTSLNRRGMLTALASAPIVAAAPAMARTNGASAFSAAVARYRLALAAEKAFDETYMAPACEAASRAEDAIPHTSAILVGREVTTHRYEDVWLCRRNRGPMLEKYHPADFAAASLIADAAEKRLAAVSALPEVIRRDAIIDRSDELCDASCKARDAVIATPVTSIAELAVKFDMIAADDLFANDGRGGAVSHLQADLQRLAKGGLN
jgi:hypothetical protein